MQPFAAIAREIGALTGARCEGGPERRVTGGSINECYRWVSAAGAMFVKVAAAEALAMFEAEAAGLAELERSRALRVPRLLACGAASGAAFLALEWIEAGESGEACEARLGEGLAALHAVTEARFGWGRDNTIGRTPQANAWSGDWTEFFRERRLRPQLELARRRGLARALSAPGERLLGCVDRLLAGHRRRPRSCTGISGAATGSRARAVSRCSSTRRSTTATGRRIWRWRAWSV